MIALCFAFSRPDGTWGAVTDDLGRLVATQNRAVAAAFSTALEARGVAKVGITEQTPEQVRALLASGGDEADPNRMFFIEAEALNAHDAVAWALDLAGRVRLTGVGDAA